MNVIEYSFKPMEEKKSFIFRLQGYEKNIYINERIKEVLENAGIQGVKFEDTRERCENPFFKIFKK
jgi:ethanolamine utilization cobalamin adenosyltransferase